MPGFFLLKVYIIPRCLTDVVNMTREQRIAKLKNGSDTAIWAASEIELLEAELADFRNHKNWTRPYDMYGDLMLDHALYKPKLR